MFASSFLVQCLGNTASDVQERARREAIEEHLRQAFFRYASSIYLCVWFVTGRFQAWFKSTFSSNFHTFSLAELNRVPNCWQASAKKGSNFYPHLEVACRCMLHLHCQKCSTLPGMTQKGEWHVKTSQDWDWKTITTFGLNNRCVLLLSVEITLYIVWSTFSSQKWRMPGQWKNITKTNSAEWWSCCSELEDWLGKIPGPAALSCCSEDCWCKRRG